jgi:hypothetical protein
LLSTALPRLERQADLSDNRATVLAQDGGMLDKQFIRTESGRDYQPSGAGFGGGPLQSIEFVSVGCRVGKQNGSP